MSEAPFPRLDLAPKLNRPLRLWWPPDYLRLLYWAFFFPQAILWYVARFGNSEHRILGGGSIIRQALRKGPIQRRLLGQAFVLLVLIVVGGLWLLQFVGLPVSVAVGVAAGVVIGVAIGAVISMEVGVAVGSALGIAVGVTGSVAFGVAFGVGGGAAVGVAYGLAFGVAFSVGGGMVTGVVTGVMLNAALSAVLGAMFSAALSATLGAAFGVTGGIAGGIAGGVVGSRLPDWLFLGLPARLIGRSGGAGRMTWLPLPGVQRELEARLAQDWTGGTRDVNQVLAYTLQFIPAVKAINTALAVSPGSALLTRVATLADGPYDWKMMRYGSADLPNRLRQEAVGGVLFWLPGSVRRRWQARFPTGLRLNTPSHTACAGFWFWHNGKAEEALDAFAVVGDLCHGPELHGIARAIASALKANDLDAIMAFGLVSDWLEALPDPELRPGTLEALRTLRQVSDEARVARNSVSALGRSAALGRANAALTRLIETGGTRCPEPEWPLIKESAEQWRNIVSKAGGVIGDEVLRRPMPNPYEGYSGLPVTGDTFVGRVGIFRQIETRWAAGENLQPLIVYGHRRMGKSSILRNLSRVAKASDILVYLDMQDAGWVDHTGQLLRDFAEAIHRRATEVRSDTGPLPTEADYADLGSARRSLNVLLERLDPQMAGRRLILAVDEYEIIEAGIEKKRIDAGVPGYLRSKAAQYRWLGLIFAGLHTLEEMGHDYRSAFYGQAEHIRVGYLSHDDAIQLITQPHPDFALEYEPELREELYRLTYGQPYLLQRLCWELVNRWNERFLREGELIPRTLTMDDLTPVLTPDFYQATGYYFDGVWSNITEPEQQLLRIMARRAEGTWMPTEIATTTGQVESAIRTTLDLLRRHDVIVDEAGGVRFAAELMRRWVADYGCPA